MYEGSNPVVSEVIQRNHFTIKDSVNLNDINWRMAFTFEGQFEEEMKDDPRYTKILIRQLQIKPDVGFREERFIPYHKCTDEDYAQFYPIQEDNMFRLDQIK